MGGHHPWLLCPIPAVSRGGDVAGTHDALVLLGPETLPRPPRTSPRAPCRVLDGGVDTDSAQARKAGADDGVDTNLPTVSRHKGSPPAGGRRTRPVRHDWLFTAWPTPFQPTGSRPRRTGWPVRRRAIRSLTGRITLAQLADRPVIDYRPRCRGRGGTPARWGPGPMTHRSATETVASDVEGLLHRGVSCSTFIRERRGAGAAPPRGGYRRGGEAPADVEPVCAT